MKKEHNDYICKEIEGKIVLEKYVGEDVNVTLPSYIQSLGEGCFSGTKVERVCLNENIDTIPKFAFQDCENLKDVSLKNIINIEDEAFYGCFNLNCSFGDKLCNIGDRAFSGCGFEIVELPKSLKSLGIAAFKNCINLKNVTINELQNLNSQVFAGCTNLESVNLPYNLKTIGCEAFLSCEKLSHIDLNEGLESIGDGAFFNSGLVCLILPSSLKSIQDFAFEACQYLQEVIFSQGIVFLGREAFKDCVNLIKVNLNGEIQKLNDYVFANCSKLKQVTLSKGIKEIGCKAFAGCKSLQIIIFCEELERICESAFSGCISLIEIELKNVKYVERKAFFNCLSLEKIEFPKIMLSLGAFAFKNCIKLKDVKLPNGLLEIKAGTFSECYSLESVIISKNVRKLCADAFSHCGKLNEVTFLGDCEIFEENVFSNSGLTKIDLPKKLKKIGANCFESSRKLEYVNFNEELIEIDEGAFKNCSALKNVIFYDNLTKVGAFCFEGCISLYKVRFGKNLKFLNNNTFFGCSSLESISLYYIEYLGKSVFENCINLENVEFNFMILKTIGDYCFKNTSLKQLEVPNCWIGDYAFANCVKLYRVSILYSTTFSIGAFSGCINLEEVTLASGCGKLGENVFENCYSLKNIKVPKSVGNLMSKSFFGCYSLKHVELENGIFEIGSNCFENCSSLEEIVLPQSMNDVGEKAFWNCSNLKRVEFPQDLKMQNQVFSNNFNTCLYFDDSFVAVLGNDLKQQPNSTKVDFNKLKKVVENFRFEDLFKGIDLKEFLQLSKKMKKLNFAFPLEFLLKLKNKNCLDKLIKNGEFTIFNNEFIGLTHVFSSLDSINKIAFFKMSLIFGCFSNEIVYNMKKSTTMMKCQLASRTLAHICKTNVFGGNYALLFDSIPFQTEAKEDFIKFVGETKNDRFENLEMLLNLELSYQKIFFVTLKNFEKVKTMRVVTGEKGNPEKVSWERAVLRNYLGQNYSNIDDENKELANVFFQKGVSQYIFDEASRLIKYSKKKNLPSHLLGKELKEIKFNESISAHEKLLRETSKNQMELAKSFKDNFTYEWLDRYDPKNLVLGHYTSCCGSITSTHYGRNIAIASVESEYVQSLVVVDNFNDIVAKGTMYLNSDLGYAVLNDFEVNALYLNKKESENKIFDAFVRGVKAFVKEYDKQNPSNPLRQVNVGGGNNKLIDICEKRCEKSNLIFEVPSNFEFQDAQVDQFIIYQNKNGKLLDCELTF